MTRVTLRLPENLHQRLRVISQKHRVSLNQLIIATLNEALAQDEGAAQEEKSLVEQVQYIRMALGDLAVELDVSQFPPHLRPGEELPDREEFMQSLPQLSPPMSRTIIEDREDRI